MKPINKLVIALTLGGVFVLASCGGGGGGGGGGVTPPNPAANANGTVGTLTVAAATVL